MTIGHYRLLFDHNTWATDRVLEQIAVIGHDVAIQPAGLDLSDGSIWETLVHMLGAEERWYARCQGDNGGSITHSDAMASTIEAVRARFDAQANAWQAFLGRLSDPDLDAIVSD